MSVVRNAQRRSEPPEHPLMGGGRTENSVCRIYGKVEERVSRLISLQGACYLCGLASLTIVPNR